MIPSGMILPRGGYPPSVLTKSFKDWTPEERESVRLHFLEPLLHKPQFANHNLADAVEALRRLTPFSPEEEVIYQKVMGYSEYLLEDHSTTASEPSMAHA